MKPIGLINAGVLLLLVRSPAPMYAQQRGEDKQRQQPAPQQQQGENRQRRQPAPQRPQDQNRQQQPRAQHLPQAQNKSQQPAAQQEPARRPAQRPQQTFGGVYHGGIQPNAPTYGGVHPSGVPQHQGQVRSGLLQSRASSWNNEHRTWQQRGGYNGYRVPEDRFKLYFGSNHFFRMNRLPMVFVGGYPRFQYDGYWVTFVDPWPDTWPPTWYQTDDIYIDYTDDGYYVYDRMRPGIGIAVTLSF
jgi:hypothetical protein